MSSRPSSGQRRPSTGASRGSGPSQWSIASPAPVAGRPVIVEASGCRAGVPERPERAPRSDKRSLSSAPRRLRHTTTFGIVGVLGTEPSVQSEPRPSRRSVGDQVAAWAAWGCRAGAPERPDTAPTFSKRSLSSARVDCATQRGKQRPRCQGRDISPWVGSFLQTGPPIKPKVTICRRVGFFGAFLGSHRGSAPQTWGPPTHFTTIARSWPRGLCWTCRVAQTTRVGEAIFRENYVRRGRESEPFVHREPRPQSPKRR